MFTSDVKKFASVLAIATSAVLAACSDQLEQPSNDLQNEMVRNFINQYGVPDPNHDWSMATKAGLTVKSADPVNLRVFAEIEGNRYLFADIASLQGCDSIPVVIPKNVSRLILEVNGMDEYVCNPNDAVDIDALAAAPRSRDYIEIDKIDPDDPDNPHDYGEFTLSSIQSSETDGRNIKYNIADNKALLDIIENPFKSQYLIYDEYENKYGETVRDPLMPNIGGIYLCKKDQAADKKLDFEFMPLYVRSDKVENTDEDYLLDISKRSETIDGVSYNVDSEYLSFSNSTYNIGYIGENGEIVNITNPSPSKTTWTGKTFKVTAKDKAFRDGLTYYIKRKESDGSPSKTYTGSFKNTTINTWDTEVGGPTNAYSNCLYFDNVPFTYYDGNDVEHTDYVYVYAIFAGPEENAATRTDRADFIIVEFYDNELYTHSTYFPTSTEHPYNFRLMAEDLGSTYDWDFNDLVVDVSAVLTNKIPIIGDGGHMSENTEDFYLDSWLKINLGYDLVYKVTVTPRAAGGTIPIYLGYFGALYTETVDLSPIKGKKVSELMKMTYEEREPYISSATGSKCHYLVNEELHSWLGGQSTEEMINTRKITNSGKTVEFYANHFEQTNFYVIVDKDNELRSTPVEGMDISKIEDAKFVYNATAGKYPDEPLEKQLIPQRIFLTSNFPWAKECKDFGEAYSEFSSWIGNASYGLNWYTTRDKSKTVEIE